MKKPQVSGQPVIVRDFIDEEICMENVRQLSANNGSSYGGFPNLLNSWDYEDILETSHDGIFVTDGTGKVLMVNTALTRICGWPKDGYIGKNAQALVDEGLSTDTAVMRAIKSGEQVTVMLNMTKGEKIGQKIMATAKPLWDENGNIRMVVANIRDITEIINLKELLEQTQQLNELYAAEIEQMRLQQIVKDYDVVARSPNTKRVLEMAARVAKVDSTVLIYGESGVGKEVIANAIHRLSNRAQGPLVKVNCSAIPETLLESELFGYEAGAFTGAKRHGKPGMFEMAKKGTLLLDEIGDIAVGLQAKLLRALQEHEIMRVGGLKPIPVDGRIIASTNKNIVQMVRKGLFRKDLFYRLNVVSIEIPPLRNRKEDIPLLVLHFCDKIKKRYQFNKRISSDVIDNFLLYSWPGNIRELENVIERMLVMTEDDEIQVKHLPSYLRVRVGPEDNSPAYEDLPLKTVIDRTEKHLIESALRKYGSTRRAARALMIDQSTLVRKMKRYK